MAITKYDLDINKQAIIKPVVILRQGDHDIDTMQVSLSVANEPMDLTGATVTFMGNTANGRQIIDDAHVKIIDAKGGVFEYVFPSEASSDIGEYKVAYFSIILANGQSSTMDFRVQVLSGVDISAPVASEYISHYDTMVTELNSAYDSFVNETDDKMASTVSSLATSAATVLDSALARVNDIDSTANNASSAASKAVSMASSVASTVTSQASYINSVASSAASNVSSVAASVVDKLNNISVGGRNLMLGTADWSGGGSRWNQRASVTKNTYLGNVIAATSKAWNNTPMYFVKNAGILQVGKTYTFSTYIRNTSDTDAKIGHYYDTSMMTPSSSDISLPAHTDWTRIFVTFQIIKDPTTTDAGLRWESKQNVTNGEIQFAGYKLEEGNIGTDWTPAPEDVDNKLSTRNATFTDFNDVAKNMVKYSGSWVIADQSIANSPLPNYYTAKITPGFSGGTDGYIELVPFASGSAKKYIAVVGSGMLSAWKSFAFDDDVVHKTGNETIAGDKTLAGKVTATNIVETGAPLSVSTTTTFNGLTFSFTRVGSSVYVTTGTTAVTTAIQPGWYDGIIPAGYRTIASVEMAYFQKPSSGGFVSTSPSGRGYFNAALVVGDKPRIVAYYPTTDPWPAN